MSNPAVSDRERASVLAEALPYIQKFAGAVIVIKYGGHAMIDPELKEKVIRDILLLSSVGLKPVVVHGGGPEISAMLKRVGKESSFANGLRVTDAETVEIASMVLVGKLNTEIVSLLNVSGGRAVGLSGHDARLLVAEKIRLKDVDLGFVGGIKQVNPAIIHCLLKEGYIPVISPLAGGEGHEAYNVNADTAAGCIAGALNADKLLLLTDVRGIMRDVNDMNTLLPFIGREEIPALIADGVLRGGMIPKAECALDALNRGAGSVQIIDGREPHAILLELFTAGGVGTMIG
jgi:acetylglutamate kinase